jgi:hypothetical protein
MLRIRGIVKAAQKAQHSLQVGISPADVPSFKKFVTGTVETIERLCSEARMTPSQLPSQSRSAYYFLKGIDFHNLPVAACATSQTQPQVKTLGIKNIKTQQRVILQKIAQVTTINSTLVQELAQKLQQNVKAIEAICTQHQATPANLTSSSRSIYAWMKFLTDTSRLQLHIETTQRVRKLGLKICEQQGQKLDNLVVDVTHLAGLYKAKRSGSTASLTISEGFISADEDVLTALVSAALLGKSESNTQLLRDFTTAEEFSDVLLELDLITEIISENPQGKCYDLDNLFAKVNSEYFAGALVKPRLTWSKIHTYRKFGHYEPSRDRVVMSLTLDDARIPQYVVEFVLYHELLHKYHGAKWSNGRRMVHTPEFRKDERGFKFYTEAEGWLRKVGRNLLVS